MTTPILQRPAHEKRVAFLTFFAWICFFAAAIIVISAVLMDVSAEDTVNYSRVVNIHKLHIQLVMMISGGLSAVSSAVLFGSSAIIKTIMELSTHEPK